MFRDNQHSTYVDMFNYFNQMEPASVVHKYSCDVSFSGWEHIIIHNSAFHVDS